MLRSSKVKITEVWLNTGCCDDKGLGAALDITLDNGSFFVISLDSKIDDPHFADILHGRYREKPKTDGERVYWNNGASLSLDETIAILQTEKGTEAAI